MLSPWQKGIVTRIEQEAEDTRRYWIEVPDLDRFDFKPGQFVTLDLPIHEKPNKRWRSYSIASWPDETNVFELVIVLDKLGAGTNWIFREVKVGSEFIFRGALGVFTLHEDLTGSDLFFICTGTGIAPFRSMANHIINHHIPHSNIYLIFGCRKKINLLYYEEMKELGKRDPQFHYIPTLSREEWDGHTGYVHKIYSELCKNRQPASFYVCGWKGMIDEAKKTILEMGYDKKSFRQEIYG